MDIELIAFNINRMLKHRITSQNIIFDIQFKNFKENSYDNKITYEIKVESNNEFIITYTNNNKVIKIVYINISINNIKSLLNDNINLILYNKGNRKINQIIERKQYKCEFMLLESFINDYRKNIYFTHCCKLDKEIENIENIENIQYISSNDFNVLYSGLKNGDLIFSVNMIDPSLLLPQIRLVKDI